MNNPLLKTNDFPQFATIQAEHFEEAIDKVLASNKEKLNTILSSQHFTWENLMAPLEALDNDLHLVFSPIAHIHNVMDSKEVRTAYEKCLNKVIAYENEVSQNEKLFEAVNSILNSSQFDLLSEAQKKVVSNSVRDFKLAGVHLSTQDKKIYKTIKEDLQKLNTKFSQNVQDATDSYFLHITDKNKLKGIPEDAIEQAKECAASKKIDGWAFSLQFPSYFAVMTYADDVSVRQQMHEAYTTRASDAGPNASKWDNTKVIEQILTLRKKLSNLLGFKNYAEYSLVPKMAKDTNEVMTFLKELSKKSYTMAKKELDDLAAFAKKEYKHDTLNAYDVAYFSEKLKQAKFAISSEELKQYFPIDKALEGLFLLVNKLYDINIEEIKNFDSWHKDVRFFKIKNKEQETLGYLYMDLYARVGKRGGAWMDDAICRYRRFDNYLQLPIAHLVCNFMPGSKDKPPLLTHSDVETLFHEFGHSLHHLLTQVEYLSVSGINAVSWDAVELPSQFMENWCWQEEALNLFSGHYKTNKPLPRDMIEKLKRAKTFQAGLAMVRQLEFALFDFRIHMEFDKDISNQVDKVLNEVRNEVAVIKQPTYNRLPHSFSHIFAGGYAAGYYSYKWAEVLSSDAFSLFEEKGIFDKATGAKFLKSILHMGGARDAMDLFIDFRGREPKIDALLRHSGII